jgi:hypothetical protein
MTSSRRIKWAVYVAPMEEMKNAYNILVETSEREDTTRKVYPWVGV